MPKFTNQTGYKAGKGRGFQFEQSLPSPKLLRPTKKPANILDCPKCGSAESKICDSRKLQDNIRRRRFCPECDARWTTYEISKEDFDLLESKKREGKTETKLQILFKAYLHSLSESEREDLLNEFYQ